LASGNGYRNYPFAGWLLQRELNKKLTLATEVFYHGAIITDARYATLLDLGGYYKFHGDDSFQLLFCYGHSVAGETENYAYLGLYWTWGEKKADSDKPEDKDKSADAAFNKLRPRGMIGHM
jgi:hypothetical protein